MRFALTKTGEWQYETVCSDTSNTGLHGKKGTINCTEYTGTREIYKHGFVSAVGGNKYFTYADGTPFFYLGDTHWTYLSEEFDTAGDRCGSVSTSSHFKYIVNKRVAQGYTVYQTEPIGHSLYDMTDGITISDIKGLRKVDQYYEYLADMGMVHANAEFFFTSSMTQLLARKDYEQLVDELCRYWVARFGAYPVMWTLAQEIDNEWYYVNTMSGDSGKSYEGREYPYLTVAKCLAKYDAYSHPLSGHMQGITLNTDPLLKKGTNASNSSFRNEACHTWWATQWKPKISEQIDFRVPEDFWVNGQGKPAVVYEANYDHLWTNEWGARVAGWLAFTNGMFGYGYGCQDMWYYKSTYDSGKDSNFNGVRVTAQDKEIIWGDAIELTSGYQAAFMKQLLEQMKWWQLVPRFDDEAYFTPDTYAKYSVASVNENETYICYFYNTDSDGTGTINNLDEKSEYNYQWFNPRTGAVSTPAQVIKNGAKFAIGNRPTRNDWVLIVTKA